MTADETSEEKRKPPVTQSWLVDLYLKAGVRNVLPAHPISKRDKFFAEFPFAQIGVEKLRTYEVMIYAMSTDDRFNISTVHVSLMTADIVERPLYCDGDYWEHVWLFDIDGRPVRHMKTTTKSFRLFWIGPRISLIKNIWIEGLAIHPQETLIDTLDALEEDASKVHFAVSYCGATQALIVYKKAPGLDLTDYRAKYKVRLRKQYEKEAS